MIIAALQILLPMVAAILLAAAAAYGVFLLLF